MSKKIVQLNESIIESECKQLMGGSVEGTLNELLETEAEETDAKQPIMSEMSSVRDTGAYITDVTSSLHLELSHSRCRSSKRRFFQNRHY